MNVQYFLQNKTEYFVQKVIVSFFSDSNGITDACFHTNIQIFFPLKITSSKSFQTIITKNPTHAELIYRKMNHEKEKSSFSRGYMAD